MSRNFENRISMGNVCRVLVDKGLISIGQAKEITPQENQILRRMKGRQDSESSKGGIRGEISAIDILSFLNLRRADNPQKVLDEETVFEALAEHWGVPYNKIDPLELDLNLVTGTISYSFALKHLVLPISVKEGALTVATPNPFNMEVLEDISRVSHMKVSPVVCPKNDILRLVDELFGFQRSIAAAEFQFATPSVDLGNLEQYVRLKPADELPSDDQHIVNAVNHLFNYAFEQRASDLHIEPKRDACLVRMRIDGVLHSVHKLPKAVHSAILSRIKNLARMDMAEKRRPQDGRIKTDKEGVEAEVRVSTVPVAFGEKAVLRIMDPHVLFRPLGNLGFTPADLSRFQEFIAMPHGIVLVCGPTGSGKTTTLYSALSQLSSPEINITTVEDPIEMVHDDFNQIAVQPAVGITFSRILRNILRQDPDVIMIGEMRDLETAENAIQAALTGHLVLSTLHTNDAPSAITRLLDMGVPAFLVQATLVGVLAQRLVRRICPHCDETFEMQGRDLAHMGLDTGIQGTVKLSRGKGCRKCRGTGYFGRIAVYEALPITESIRRLVKPELDQEAVGAQALKEGMVKLRTNATQKFLKGRTTYQEVLRIT